MSAPEKGTCRSCGAPIRWIRRVGGKAHPVNEPSERRYVETETGEYRLREVWLTHFATCPQAKQWRPTGDKQEG